MIMMIGRMVILGHWFQYEKQFLETVEVLDKKAKSSGGFK